MRFAAIENFKGFATSRPPLMVFMICLGFFAVILLSLAYYVKTKELTNPDISQVLYKEQHLKTNGILSYLVES